MVDRLTPKEVEDLRAEALAQQRKNTKKRIGLVEKYIVLRHDCKPVEWAFVLQDTDPLAVPALRAYSVAAREAGYHALADDLDAKVESLSQPSSGAPE